MTNHSNIKLNTKELDLISNFEKRLETIFFSETKVVICPSEEDLFNLVIEINPTFSLAEMISLLRLPAYSYQWSSLNKMILNFKNEVLRFYDLLPGQVDIEEVSIYFRNTSITINSFNRNSILEEIIFITYSIIQHFDNYSTIMGSMPNAIHIPVIEDPTTKQLFGKDNSIVPPTYISPYAKYWGLYFDILNKPVVYDLQGTNITPGDLDINLE